MIPFKEFKERFLDSRVEDGHDLSIMTAYGMAHAYVLLSGDLKEQNEAAKHSDKILSLVLEQV